MEIWVDADACPKAAKEILFKAAQRLKVIVVLVANQVLKIPLSPYITSIRVESGLNIADDYIAENCQSDDLVITSDIPLASRIIEKKGLALSPKGVFFTPDNIKQKLSIRNFLDELRSGGVETGGPSAFNMKDRQNFANSLDSFLRKKCI